MLNHHWSAFWCRVTHHTLPMLLMLPLVLGRATRFSFEVGKRQLALCDSPPGAQRAWHGPLTVAQCQQFVKFGWVFLPSVLSAAERGAGGPPPAEVLKQRLHAPLQSCRNVVRANTPGSDPTCEIWLAVDGDATIEIAQQPMSAKGGDALIVNPDVCNNVQRNDSESARQMLERAGLICVQPLPRPRL